MSEEWKGMSLRVEVSVKKEVKLEIGAKHVEFKTDNNMLHNDSFKDSRQEL